MGNVTTTIVKTERMGRETAVILKIQMSNSYATNGDTIKLADTGLTYLDACIITPVAGRVAEYDLTNNKIIVYQQSAATGALTQPASTTDLSATTFYAVAYGR